MQLEGTHTFNAPLPAVWEALMDPAILAQALPGGEEVVRLSDSEYQAAMNVRIGPVQGKFDGRIELLDVDPMRSYRLRVSGQGAPGFVNGEGTLLLEGNGENATLLRYTGDVQIGGKIAGVSQRLVESTAKSLTRQGLQALDRQIQARLQAPAVETTPLAEAAIPQETPRPSHAPAPTPAPAAPSAASVAANVARDVARDLAADYAPLNQQEKIFWAVVGALGMLLFVVLVRLVQKR